MNEDQPVETKPAESVPDSPASGTATPVPEAPPIKIKRLPYLLSRQRTGMVPVVLAEDLPRNWEKKCGVRLRKGNTVNIVEVSEWLVGPGKVDKQFLFWEGVRHGLSLKFGQFIPPKPEEKPKE